MMDVLVISDELMLAKSESSSVTLVPKEKKKKLPD
jgi:hypothetical protein